MSSAQGLGMLWFITRRGKCSHGQFLMGLHQRCVAFAARLFVVVHQVCYSCRCYCFVLLMQQWGSCLYLSLSLSCNTLLCRVLFIHASRTLQCRSAVAIVVNFYC